MSQDMSALESWLDEFKRIWPTESRIDRWMDRHFDLPWSHDIRREWIDNEQRLWSIPDYERGRTRCIAISRSVLRDHDAETIMETLQAADWFNRLDREDLLLCESATGTLEVVAADHVRSDKWFWIEDRAEWFVAFQSEAGGVSVGHPPPPIRRFIALHGKHHAAVGPEGVHRIADLTLDAIRGHIPRKQG